MFQNSNYNPSLALCTFFITHGLPTSQERRSSRSLSRCNTTRTNQQQGTAHQYSTTAATPSSLVVVVVVCHPLFVYSLLFSSVWFSVTMIARQKLQVLLILLLTLVAVSNITLVTTRSDAAKMTRRSFFISPRPRPVRSCSSLPVTIKVTRLGCSGQLSFPFWLLPSSLTAPLPMNPLSCSTRMPITGDARR